MTISKKAFRSSLVKSAIDRDGRFEIVIKGVKALIEKRSKKYEITRTEGNEKPDFWVYRRERIALDRFDELMVSLSRRRT